jgi:hypothetical protein
MNPLRFTLVSDGSSDQALIPLLRWLLAQHLPGIGLEPQWADLRVLSRPPTGLAERIRTALDLYPADLLFVHRDAEGQPPELRYQEIREALAEIPNPPAVCVVPIRMTEAWLLIDERAIRQAADNPTGQAPLELPALQRLESLPNPKSILHAALREASQLRGRRASRFRINDRVHQVARWIGDYSPLRQLSAFQNLERDLQLTMRLLQDG